MLNHKQAMTVSKQPSVLADISKKQNDKFAYVDMVAAKIIRTTPIMDVVNGYSTRSIPLDVVLRGSVLFASRCRMNFFVIRQNFMGEQ